MWSERIGPPVGSRFDRRANETVRLRIIHTMEVLRQAYAAFNARDIEGALALMQPDVDWPNGMEGGRELGHDAVRAYWTRQFGLIDSHVEPIAFTEAADGRIAVDVHATVRDLEGKVLSDGRVTHVYTLRDGLVARMDIVSRT
jgi:ketosteroid isomerase-like protein